MVQRWGAPVEVTVRPYRFGRFTLDPGRRQLLAGEARVALSSRAFDILVLLVEARGRVVSREEILRAVWRGVSVEENNLPVQMSGLRRALGEGPGGAPWIVTVPGRGYRFVGEVEAEEEPPAPVPVADGGGTVDAGTLVPAGGGTVLAPAVGMAAGRRRGRWLAGTGVLLLLLAVMGAREVWRGAGPEVPAMSIALAPAVALGGDPVVGGIAASMGEDLFTEVAQIPESVVVMGEAAPGQVRTRLRTSLRRAGPILVVNAQIVREAGGASLWSERFEVPWGEAASMQDTVVRHLAIAVDAHLTEIEAGRLAAGRGAAPEWLALFVRARAAHRQAQSLAALGEVQGLLERAAGLRPEAASVQAELGSVLLDKVRKYDDPEEDRDYEAARAAATQAIRLSPHEATALAAEGQVQQTAGQCDEAEASFRAALARNPASLGALGGLASCDLSLGRPVESAKHEAELVRIDPEGAGKLVRYQHMAIALLMAGDASSALPWLVRERAADPDFDSASENLGRREWAHLALIAAWQMTGARQLAIDAYRAYRNRWPNRSVFRLQLYFSRAMSRQPGFRAFFEALASVGMPRVIDEQRLEQLAGTMGEGSSDFDPPPPSVAGARLVTTAEVRAKLADRSPPVVVDVGRGAAAIPGAIIGVSPHGDPREFVSRVQAFTGRLEGRSVIVMGDGGLGRNSAQAALFLAPFANVLWYRGGEEAWTAGGGPVEDRRPS